MGRRLGERRYPRPLKRIDANCRRRATCDGPLRCDRIKNLERCEFSGRVSVDSRTAGVMILSVRKATSTPLAVALKKTIIRPYSMDCATYSITSEVCRPRITLTGTFYPYGQRAVEIGEMKCHGLRHASANGNSAPEEMSPRNACLYVLQRRL